MQMVTGEVASLGLAVFGRVEMVADTSRRRHIREIGSGIPPDSEKLAEVGLRSESSQYSG